jgi:hypothetical protein
VNFVVRARYVQPDGIGWLTKDGHVTHARDGAQTYATEADAWTHLTSLDEWWGSGEEGQWYWVEPADLEVQFERFRRGVQSEQEARIFIQEFRKALVALGEERKRCLKIVESLAEQKRADAERWKKEIPHSVTLFANDQQCSASGAAFALGVAAEQIKKGT